MKSTFTSCSWRSKDEHSSPDSSVNVYTNCHVAVVMSSKYLNLISCGSSYKIIGVSEIIHSYEPSPAPWFALVFIKWISSPLHKTPSNSLVETPSNSLIVKLVDPIIWTWSSLSSCSLAHPVSVFSTIKAKL